MDKDLVKELAEKFMSNPTYTYGQELNPVGEFWKTELMEGIKDKKNETSQTPKKENYDNLIKRFPNIIEDIISVLKSLNPKMDRKIRINEYYKEFKRKFPKYIHISLQHFKSKLYTRAFNKRKNDFENTTVSFDQFDDVEF